MRGASGRCYTRNRPTGPNAGVAELADARDSKSRALHWACGFDPHLQHQRISPFFIITRQRAEGPVLVREVVLLPLFPGMK
jgi:hypothetical protein